MPYLDLHRTITALGIESRGVDAIGNDFDSGRPAWAQGTISEYDSVSWPASLISPMLTGSSKSA